MIVWLFARYKGFSSFLETSVIPLNCKKELLQGTDRRRSVFSAVFMVLFLFSRPDIVNSKHCPKTFVLSYWHLSVLTLKIICWTKLNFLQTCCMAPLQLCIHMLAACWQHQHNRFSSAMVSNNEYIKFFNLHSWSELISSYFGIK